MLDATAGELLDLVLHRLELNVYRVGPLILSGCRQSLPCQF
ncbi:peroxisomal (S)-2-hydroxy-acid oxidase GLO1 isoform X2 [Iris pallida]|uniref:Peroxisomal (S)-2-hydroxy-acid oxidase GLO1 isoform X2 n=1 Tax=Iris pallida TaxID=29817 RepID=A0AAX6IJG3_IRIPA|nr:peroxisomal (S)-2-hydroxy-acid oxidase GLO1 isoform X2 [Iris pallida]